MPRPPNPDLLLPWKITMPATLAGTIEFMLLDPLSSKPRYASRGRLIIALLERWVAEQRGTPENELPRIPTLEELRAQ